MASFRYKAHVRVESGTEEVQFEPLDQDAPRIRSLYESDRKLFNKYVNGRTYRINPERLEDEAEEEQAAAQAADSKADAEAMRDGPPPTRKPKKSS